MLKAVEAQLSEVDAFVSKLKQRQDQGKDVRINPEGQKKPNAKLPSQKNKRARKPKRVVQEQAVRTEVTQEKPRQEEQETSVVNFENDTSTSFGDESLDHDLIARARAIIEAANLLSVENIFSHSTLLNEEQETERQVEVEPKPTTKESIAELVPSETETENVVQQAPVVVEDDVESTPLFQFMQEERVEEDYMWIPLAKTGMITAHVATIFFNTDCREEKDSAPIVGDVVQIEEEEYTIEQIDSDEGLKLKLNRAIVKEPRLLERDGTGKIFVKMGISRATEAQVRRAKMCGKGKVFRPSTGFGKRSESKVQRKRETFERKRMEEEEQHSRNAEKESQRKSEMTRKAKELHEKTLLRVKQKREQEKALELKQQQQEELKKQEEAKRRKELEERCQQAAEESRKRVLRRQRAKKESENDPRDESASVATENSVQLDSFRMKTKARLRRHMEEEKKRHHQENQETSEKKEKIKDTTINIVDPERSEKQIRLEARRRREKFNRLAQAIKASETARYESVARQRIPKRRSDPSVSSNINVQPEVDMPVQSGVAFRVIDE